MSTLGWIVVSGIVMSGLALVGSVALVLPERTFKKLVLPMVSLAAGSLLGGALFHMLPEAIDEVGNRLAVYIWLCAGSCRSSCSSSTCTGTTATAPSVLTGPSASSSWWLTACTT